MVTNNEVSEQEGRDLRAKGCKRGDSEWEQYGICRTITWPRSKYTILGKRDDGTELEGEYTTGRIVLAEEARRFRQIGFTSNRELKSLTKKRQLVALIADLPQSAVRVDSAFVVSPDYPVSILFDESQSDSWLASLEGQEHILDFYVVTGSKTTFLMLRDHVREILGPLMSSKEEKYPVGRGFPTNLEYFRLDFLDKDNVALGRQFREVLPILWLRAGAFGRRPVLYSDESIPPMMIPEGNRFAVLVEEARFGEFASRLDDRDDLSHVYLVTGFRGCVSGDGGAFARSKCYSVVPGLPGEFRNKYGTGGYVVKVEVFDFQENALSELRTKIAAARMMASMEDPQAVSFAAPTGSGKTIIMTSLFEDILFGEPGFEGHSDASILWISDVPELNEQTRLKIEGKSDRIRVRQLVTIDATFDARQLQGGCIYFVNSQKLGSEKLLTRRGDGRQHTIWETLTNTA